MIDKEKVHKGLECCSQHDCMGKNCPYWRTGSCDTLKNDALELLEQQEKEIRALKACIPQNQKTKMAKYIKLEDVQSFPIRIDHCDHKNGNIHFMLGIETVMEYIDYLPQYKLPEAEPINRPDFEYKENNNDH